MPTRPNKGDSQARLGPQAKEKRQVVKGVKGAKASKDTGEPAGQMKQKQVANDPGRKAGQVAAPVNMFDMAVRNRLPIVPVRWRMIRPGASETGSRGFPAVEASVPGLR